MQQSSEGWSWGFGEANGKGKGSRQVQMVLRVEDIEESQRTFYLLRILTWPNLVARCRKISDRLLLLHLVLSRTSSHHISL